MDEYTIVCLFVGEAAQKRNISSGEYSVFFMFTEKLVTLSFHDAYWASSVTAAWLTMPLG